jgi:hypothetical protein
MVGASYLSATESSVGRNKQRQHSGPNIGLGVGGRRPLAGAYGGLTFTDAPLWPSSQPWGAPSYAGIQQVQRLSQSTSALRSGALICRTYWLNPLHGQLADLGV